MQRSDGMDQFKRAVLTPGQILDQAHHETVFFDRIDHYGGDLGLAKCDECLKATLTTDEVESGLAWPLAHRDRLLEAEMSDAVHQFLEDPLIPNPRIEDRDEVDLH